jgi:hypothetical protein
MIRDPSFAEHLWCALDSTFGDATTTILLGSAAVAAWAFSAPEPTGDDVGARQRAKKAIATSKVLAVIAAVLGLFSLIVPTVVFAQTRGTTCDVALSVPQEWTLMIAIGARVLALGMIAVIAIKKP